MAKVERNIVINGLRGRLGEQLVIKRDRAGHTIVSLKPTFREDREFSEMQKAQQGAFKEAVVYAKTAAKTVPIYAEKAEGTNRAAYNIAIADWLHPPEIGEIDLSGWTGQAGEPIRIKALDDVKVMEVMVLIVDEADGLIEQGEAEQTDGLWWTYTTRQAASGQAKVIVIARDLPGNIGQGIQEAVAKCIRGSVSANPKG